MVMFKSKWCIVCFFLWLLFFVWLVCCFVFFLCMCMYVYVCGVCLFFLPHILITLTFLRMKNKAKHILDHFAALG